MKINTIVNTTSQMDMQESSPLYMGGVVVLGTRSSGPPPPNIPCVYLAEQANCSNMNNLRCNNGNNALSTPSFDLQLVYCDVINSV